MSLVSKCFEFIRVISHDFRNKLKYGEATPNRYQLFWVNPQNIQLSTKYFILSDTKILNSGNDIDQNEFMKFRNKFISNGDWDKETTDLMDCSIISRAIEHYSTGKSWDKVGENDWFNSRIAELGVQDGCLMESDVKERLNRLDALFSSIKQHGQIFIRKKINKYSFRELDGIGIGVNRSGEIIWIADGAHRLSAALILKLEYIPVCLMIIHEKAVISSNYTKNLLTDKQYKVLQQR